LSGLDLFGHGSLKLAHDGLEGEFKCFNRLERAVRTTRAPGDKRKSNDCQCEQAF
jgi:hypothetical protein